MVSVSASVNLPLHHKVQKFSSGTGWPGWSRKKGRKTVVCMCVCVFVYATMRVWNKDLWHLWPAKMLDANLGWLWTKCYRGCDWPVARESEIMCPCWWRTVWTHAAKLLFICIMWFIRTFYETVIVIWCIWRLFCSYFKSWICVHMHFRCFKFNKVV